MKPKFSLSISNAIAIVTASLLAYYLLLCENFLHTSISEIIDYSDTLEVTQHMLILGLLPIYIAAMVFGAAMFGIYLGSILQHIIFKNIKNNNSAP